MGLVSGLGGRQLGMPPLAFCQGMLGLNNFLIQLMKRFSVLRATQSELHFSQGFADVAAEKARGRPWRGPKRRRQGLEGRRAAGAERLEVPEFAAKPLSSGSHLRA